jgi:mRNA deadenylase 3'-5' endonuclease subunit Ccr4
VIDPRTEIIMLRREFVTTDDAKHQTDPTSTIRVLQFNTLADYLSDAFPLADPKVLKWEHRASLLIHELTQYQPDIIAAQEVQHYAQFFAPALESHGYKGFFQKKSTDQALDGCALWYRPDRVQLVKCEGRAYAEATQVYILAQFLTLTTTAAGGTVTPLHVAVTHLKAKEPFEQKRLQQVTQLLQDSKQPSTEIQ